MIPPEMMPFVGETLHYAVSSILSGTVHDAFKKVIGSLKEDIPLKHRQIPKHNIFIPALEGYALNPDQPILQKMFYNLLVNAMDKTKQDLCHPAFPNILRQLSEDDILLLYLFRQKVYVIGAQGEYITDKDIETLNFPYWDYFLAKIGKKKVFSTVWFSIQHLKHLDLLRSTDITKQGEDQSVYDIVTTEKGKIFIDACINNESRELLDKIILENKVVMYSTVNRNLQLQEIEDYLKKYDDKQDDNYRRVLRIYDSIKCSENTTL